MLKKYGVVLALVAVCAFAALALAGCGTSDGAASTEVAPADGSAAAEPAQDTSALAVGEVVNRDGVTIGVLKVEAGPKDWSQEETLKVTVTYKNETDEAISFNTYDWASETAGGVRAEAGIVDADTIDSGELAPGGEMTGEVYLPAKDATKIVFTANMFLDSEDDLLVWVL